MASNEQQQFLNSLEKKLWQSTDKLRSTLDPADFSTKDYQTEIASELEQRDYYTEQNVFWVPKEARWQFLQDKNKAAIPNCRSTSPNSPN